MSNARPYCACFCQSTKARTREVGDGSLRNDERVGTLIETGESLARCGGDEDAVARLARFPATGCLPGAVGRYSATVLALVNNAARILPNQLHEVNAIAAFSTWPT